MDGGGGGEGIGAGIDGGSGGEGMGAGEEGGGGKGGGGRGGGGGWANAYKANRVIRTANKLSLFMMCPLSLLSC